MFQWMMYWIWWLGWRVVVTLAGMFTIQNIVYKEEGLWLDTKPLLIQTILMVLMIVVWSTRSHPFKESK